MSALVTFLIIIASVTILTLSFWGGVLMGLRSAGHTESVADEKTPRLAGNESRSVMQEYASELADVGHAGKHLVDACARSPTTVPGELTDAIRQLVAATESLRDRIETRSKAGNASSSAMAGATSADGQRKSEQSSESDSSTAIAAGPAEETRDASVHQRSAEDRAERRQRRDGTLLLAPMHGDKLPAFEDFHAVRCFEISSREVCYFVEQPPDYERFVLRMGTHDRPIFIVGEVVSSRTAYKYERVGYLVESCFVRRVQDEQMTTDWTAFSMSAYQ